MVTTGPPTRRIISCILMPSSPVCDPEELCCPPAGATAGSHGVVAGLDADTGHGALDASQRSLTKSMGRLKSTLASADCDDDEGTGGEVGAPSPTCVRVCVCAAYAQQVWNALCSLLCACGGQISHEGRRKADDGNAYTYEEFVAFGCAEAWPKCEVAPTPHPLITRTVPPLRVS